MVVYLTPYVKRFKDASFDTFKTPSSEHLKARQFLMDSAQTGLRKNVFLLGGVGTGKTYLAYSFLKEVARLKWIELTHSFWWQSDVCLIVHMKKILDKIKDNWKAENKLPSGAVLEAEKNVPVLIIDEVGLQYGTSFERLELFDLFNSRYENMLPTICLSNLKMEEIERILGKRIFDRLSQNRECFYLSGKSQRLKEEK